MKKLLVLSMGILLTISACFTQCFADGLAEDNPFRVISIPCDTENHNIKARYTDSKQAITLSKYYDGYLFATVPAENADREIEAFLPEAIPFTDNDDMSYAYYVMGELSRTGVVFGNEKGEALPDDDVTRAEATAMIMRFLGLGTEVGYEPGFEDVSVNDWFYNVVAAATEAGIVKGDSKTTFSPDRNVTREEFTVMTARAMEYAGLDQAEYDVYTYDDIADVSDWAIEAYEIVGSNAITDADIVGFDDSILLLNPQKNATRYDVAKMMYDVDIFCQVYPSKQAMEFGFDKGMPVIDGSTSTYPFTRAVYGRLFFNGLNHEQMPASHSKTHASYQRLINGEVDMIFASVYPASDILELAEENDVELELIPIAFDAMIFYTNAENRINGLTSEQISNIYVNNAYKNWSELGGPDALLYPYCRNNDSGSHAQMEKHFLNGSEIHPDIRRETTSMTMSSVLTDVMDSKTDDPAGYGLGYSIYYYYHNMDAFYGTKEYLKLLEIDGVYPDDETIADGSYPLSNNTYLVLRKDTPKDHPARKMAEFMLTEEGQQCVVNAGFGPLK